MFKKKCRYICLILLAIVVICSNQFVFALNTNINMGQNNWWEDAFNFLQGYNGTNTTIVSGVTVGSLFTALNPIVSIVEIAGNMAFITVTIILGVKYIWGGVEGKTSAKESFITLVVAAVVFYSWSTISGLLLNDRGNLNFISGDINVTLKNIFVIIVYICDFLAIGGLAYIGARYMLAGAEGKAQIKAHGFQIVLGIVMVYATVRLLSLILNLVIE